ncbi:MAG: hypothetical protein KAR54_01045 [Candidatus Pacebacteria bacterium]|nr:hypothetical protein [Candidatus Paceibacterota bacterium]
MIKKFGGLLMLFITAIVSLTFITPVTATEKKALVTPGDVLIQNMSSLLNPVYVDTESATTTVADLEKAGTWIYTFEINPEINFTVKAIITAKDFGEFYMRNFNTSALVNKKMLKQSGPATITITNLKNTNRHNPTSLKIPPFLTSV